MPIKPDPECRFPEILAVLYIRQQRGMQQLMHKDSEYFGKVRKIGPDDDLMVTIIGRAGLPALSGHLSLFAERCERDGVSESCPEELDRAWRNKASVHWWRSVNSFHDWCDH